jgi:hypothetical protein
MIVVFLSEKMLNAELDWAIYWTLGSVVLFFVCDGLILK